MTAIASIIGTRICGLSSRQQQNHTGSDHVFQLPPLKSRDGQNTRLGAYPLFGGRETMVVNGVTRARAVGHGTDGAPGFGSGPQPIITETSSRKTSFRIGSNPQRIAC